MSICATVNIFIKVIGHFKKEQINLFPAGIELQPSAGEVDVITNTLRKRKFKLIFYFSIRNVR